MRILLLYLFMVCEFYIKAQIPASITLSNLKAEWKIDSAIQHHARFEQGEGTLLSLLMKSVSVPGDDDDMCVINSKISIALPINEEGKVEDSKIIKSICPAVDNQIINLAKGLTFKPAIKNGKPVKDLFYFPLQICLR